MNTLDERSLVIKKKSVVLSVLNNHTYRVVFLYYRLFKNLNYIYHIFQLPINRNEQ